jgi:hypothetical protein
MKQILFWLIFSIPLSHASIRPELFHTADTKKTQAYIEDGIFLGGDRSIDASVIKDIRRAKNGSMERFVIDLEGSMNGEPTAIDRPPYYQVAVNRDENRIVFSIWGKSRLQFDSNKVLKALRKSPALSSVELYPKLESDTWTFVLDLKSPQKIEVFELSDPVRIIVDLESAGKKKVKH